MTVLLLCRGHVDVVSHLLEYIHGNCNKHKEKYSIAHKEGKCLVKFDAVCIDNYTNRIKII